MNTELLEVVVGAAATIFAKVKAAMVEVRILKIERRVVMRFRLKSKSLRQNW